MTPERLAVNDRWYSEDEVYKLLQREQPLLIPHAAWFARHLNLAFSKGKQLGSGEVTADIDQLRTNDERWRTVLNRICRRTINSRAWKTDIPCDEIFPDRTTIEDFTAAIDKLRTQKAPG